MSQDLPPIAIPDFPEFNLTDEEIRAALKYPITKSWRGGEITIQEEKIDSYGDRKPKYANRVLISGIKAWEESGDRPLATLIKHLLLAFFLGKISGSRTVVARDTGDAQRTSMENKHSFAPSTSDTFFIDPSEIPDYDEDIDSDYDFSGLG